MASPNVSLRRAVTSIVSSPSSPGGGAVALTEQIVTQDLVADKYEILTAGDCDTPQKIADAINRVQRNIHDSTRAARSLPSLGGAYHCGVIFAAYTPVILTTRIQGAVSWTANRVRPANGYLRISNVSASSGKIKVTTVTPNSLKAGDTVVLNGVVGVTNANAAWQVLTVVDDLNFTLAGSTYAGAGYVNGGAVYCASYSIWEAASDANNGRITLASDVALTADVHVFPQPVAARQ